MRSRRATFTEFIKKKYIVENEDLKRNRRSFREKELRKKDATDLNKLYLIKYP